MPDALVSGAGSNAGTTPASVALLEPGQASGLGSEEAGGQDTAAVLRRAADGTGSMAAGQVEKRVAAKPQTPSGLTPATKDVAADADAGALADVLAKNPTPTPAAAGPGRQDGAPASSMPCGFPPRVPVEGRPQQGKSSVGDVNLVAGVTTAADALAPVASSVADAKADTRQRGDGQTALRSAAPAVAAASTTPSLFDAQMRLSADPLVLERGLSPAQASTAAAAGSGVVDSDVSRQIVQAIRLQWSAGGGTASVTLQPDYLGELRIDIRVDHGAVTAVLDASNASVRQWLEGHEPLLRQGLSEQGLTLARLVIKDEPPQSSTSRDAPQEQPRQQPQRRQAPATPTDATFEVVM